MFLVAKLAYCTLSTLIVLHISQYVEKVENMKQIEVKPNGKAEFELDMKLKNPKSNIYLYKVRATSFLTAVMFSVDAYVGAT